MGGDARALFDCARACGANSLYQWMDSDTDAERAAAFLRDARAEGLRVYALMGDAAWTAERMTQAIALAESLGKEEGLAGVVLDVEPYLLEGWDEERDAIMRRYLDGLEEAGRAAKEAGLELAVCVPCFYDSWGLEEALERIVCLCDRLVVMNYQRGREGEMIQTELGLARKWDKAIMSVYEFQRPGVHGLTAGNTYFSEGVHAARRNFDGLWLRSGYARLGMGLHSFEAIREIGYE